MPLSTSKVGEVRRRSCDISAPFSLWPRSDISAAHLAAAAQSADTPPRGGARCAPLSRDEAPCQLTPAGQAFFTEPRQTPLKPTALCAPPSAPSEPGELVVDLRNLRIYEPLPDRDPNLPQGHSGGNRSSSLCC
jgi:hypothetical protein